MKKITSIFIGLPCLCIYMAACEKPKPATTPISNPITPVLTAETLEQWLCDKEIVTVVFASPNFENWDKSNKKMNEIAKWLEERGDLTPYSQTDATFFCYYYGSGVEKDQWVHVEVTLYVTPDNMTRLLKLQRDLKDLDYHLDVEKVNVLLYMSDVESRRKARAIIPDWAWGAWGLAFDF